MSASEDELIERLNRDGFATPEAPWNAEKAIVALVLAEKQRRRSFWYHVVMLVISVASAIAAWVAAFHKC